MSSVQQPRRADGVAPRRTAIDAGANNYDSQEVPVLIRIPDMSSEPEEAAALASTATTHRRDSAHTSDGRNRASQSTKKRRPIETPPESISTRFVVGGILGGVVLVVALFLINGSSSDGPDETVWPESDTETSAVAGGVEVEIPTEDTMAPDTQLATDTDIATESMDLDPSAVMDPPKLADVPSLDGSQIASQDESPAANATHAMHTAPGWNAAPSTPLVRDGSQTTTTQKIDGWPAQAYGDGYRASQNASQDEVYRTSQLDRESSPTNEPRGNILDGNIVIPEQTSLR